MVWFRYTLWIHYHGPKCLSTEGMTKGEKRMVHSNRACHVTQLGFKLSDATNFIFPYGHFITKCLGLFSSSYCQVCSTWLAVSCMYIHIDIHHFAGSEQVIYIISCSGFLWWYILQPDGEMVDLVNPDNL